MKILVTNDDGIFAQGLWVLVKELKNIAQVVVVAPDREQSAVGTAVTLRQPLRVRTVTPMVPGIETYSVEGTPGDSVIMALGRLVNHVDLVISGINHGLNLGEDVLISGTVGAALQGYLRGLSAIAVSLAESEAVYLENTARIASALAKRIHSNHLPANLFLNLNVPSLPLSKMSGVKVTRLATRSHIDTVDEGHDGRHEYYWLVRRQSGRNLDHKTDIAAIEGGSVSITPLAITLPTKPAPSILDTLCSDLISGLDRLTE